MSPLHYTPSSIAISQAHPLDFTLQYPARREYFQDNFRGKIDPQVAQTLPETLLYVHVPFCEKKCYFCNFAVDVRQSPEVHNRYTRTLCEQIRRLNDFLPPYTTVAGVDIGGGTPTLLNSSQLEEILATIALWAPRFTSASPLSIETTPRIAAEHPERLDVLRAWNINRISIGVQSVNANTLSTVNRSLQQDMTEKAIKNIRKAGFQRINADIIFGLPGQDPTSWEATVRSMIDIGVDSITTYDCLYRGKGRAMTLRTPQKPSPEVFGTLYDLSYQMLKDAGFHAAYGSVNFSRHIGETGTSPYFEGRLFHHTPYLGVGNYASSQVGNQWWFAPLGVEQWQSRVDAGDIFPIGDVYTLPAEELMTKQVLLSLNFGVIDENCFNRRFGVNLCDIYKDALDYAQLHGLLQKTATGYCVAQGKFGQMHLIRSLFYTQPAIEWLTNFSKIRRLT
jgi:oxygen-independent coproporphyrinogen-3 oxidase